SKKRAPDNGQDADDLAETRRKARRINHYLDLVPARYYLGTESAQAKGGKWAHLDPKLAKSTTQLIAEAATAEDQPATASKKKKSKDKRARSLSQSPEPSGPNSRAELREKLNRRIEELKEERRRKQSEADKAKAAEVRAAREKAAASAPNGVKTNHKSEARGRAAQAEEDEEPEVGRVSFDAEASGLPFEASVGHRGKKVKKLQAELRKQEADAAKLREAERRGEGEELRKELAYEKALQRARGEK
ncbi:Gstt1, partial [Symbiodinium natans]